MGRPVRHSVGVRDGGGSLLRVSFLFRWPQRPKAEENQGIAAKRHKRRKKGTSPSQATARQALIRSGIFSLKDHVLSSTQTRNGDGSKSSGNVRRESSQPHQSARSRNHLRLLRNRPVATFHLSLFTASSASLHEISILRFLCLFAAIPGFSSP